MKGVLYVCVVFLVLILTNCQSSKHRDSYAQSARKNKRSTKYKDSYSASSNRKVRLGYRDTYSNAGGRIRGKEGKDSYAAQEKKSFKFWRKWKVFFRKRRVDTYGVSRKRKKIKKRKPPQGIRNS